MAAVHDGLLHIRAFAAILSDSGTSNIPEETIWYRHRMVGSWLPISLAMPFIRFIIPFFDSAVPAAKRSLKVIGAMAVWEPGGGIHRSLLGGHADLLQDRAASRIGWIWRLW